MREIIIKNLEARFAAYSDLIALMNEGALQERLEAKNQKNVAEHLWCVIGARESHTKALLDGEWKGFSCSLSSFSPSDFENKLEESAADFVAVVESVQDWTKEREELLAALAEHEVMHEGQLIRHLLGKGRTVPSSWKWA